jgi:type VI secretion system protein ImpL
MSYLPRKWDDNAFPFTDDFLSLLTVESTQFDNLQIKDSYDVTISAVATLVDAQATEKPERTSLTLKSTDSVQTMDIFNYPSSQNFNWKPATGSDTTLTISFPSMDLFLSYSGPNAFPSFLNELISGDLILVPSDFPDHEQQLKQMGITRIRIIMKADGAIPVIRYHSLEPLPIPNSIIKAE